ncbi:hypothetical protein [Mangrovibacterium sp.]|uniref:hypothetical protein n=1 Tax=Mangrovibacterium sp. TaxID=1961364 RepID=UPI003563DD20
MKKRIIFFLSLCMVGMGIVVLNSCTEDELFSIKEVVITWETPAELVEGLPLTETQLNATANVPGKIVFTPALGTVLALGNNQELKAEFTPMDSKYPSLSKTVNINIVEKYMPVITWGTPAVLPLGDALTDEQLNAKANVPGTFVYTPALGTVLPLGENQELRVDFTPSVATHQATSATVMINVRDVVPIKYSANSAMYTGEQSFAFNVSGAVGSLGNNPAAGFTVHVTNTAKFVDKDVEISSLSLDPTNAARIMVTLAEMIYADDMITIAFDNSGSEIVSADEQALLSFTAQQVSIPVAGANLLEGNSWAGFEGTADGNSAGAFGYWVGTALPWQRTTDLFASGAASMKYTGGFDVKPLYGMNFGDNLDIQAGAYEVSHKIYIAEGSDLKMLRTAIARKSTGWGDDVAATWDVENVERGTWVTIKQIMNFPVAYNISDKTRYSYYVQASLNVGVTGDQTFYLDDMGLKKVDVAPRP